MRQSRKTGTLPWRRWYPRTKTGCLTCRRRRKKCDERKPGCVNCQRNGLSCCWPDAKDDASSRPADGAVVSRLPPSDHASASDDPDSQTPHGSELVRAAGVPVSTDSCAYTCTDTGSPGWPVSVSPPPASSSTTGDQGRQPSSRPEAAGGSTPPPSPSRPLFCQRAIDLTESSPMLLQHYLSETSILLSTKTGPLNPYITCIIPVACSDDLLMHAVLSLSGLHMGAKQQHRLGESGREIQLAALRHRGLVLCQLRDAISRCDAQKNDMQTIKILMTLLMLCHAEAITRHHKGAIFPHLRACRQLISTLDLGNKVTRDEAARMRGFALEIYAYLVLVANITPYGIAEDRTLAFDPIHTSLAVLSEYQTFGIMFSSMHGLFEMIPTLSLLATERLSEEKDAPPGEFRDSKGTAARFEALRLAIETWTPPPDDGADGAPKDAADTELQTATEVYRHALLIYLHASTGGSVVSNPKVMYRIQEHVEPMFPLLMALSNSLLGAILLWPVMIMGSCLLSPAHRDLMVSCLNQCRYRTDNLLQALELFKLLWEDQDPRCFGPYGLSLIMRKHDINFCMS